MMNVLNFQGSVPEKHNEWLHFECMKMLHNIMSSCAIETYDMTSSLNAAWDISKNDLTYVLGRCGWWYFVFAIELIDK